MVESLEQKGAPTVFQDEESVRNATWLFREEGWRPNEDLPLKPHHRVTLLAKDGRRFRYFLGSFSDPPRAPCFSFCSGYWATAVAPDGKPRKDLFLALATSVDLFRLMDLLQKKEP